MPHWFWVSALENVPSVCYCCHCDPLLHTLKECACFPGCRVFDESGEASIIHSANPWCWEGAVQSTEGKARHTQVWPHLPCLSCRTGESQEQRKGESSVFLFIVESRWWKKSFWPFVMLLYSSSLPLRPLSDFLSPVEYIIYYNVILGSSAWCLWNCFHLSSLVLASVEAGTDNTWVKVFQYWYRNVYFWTAKYKISLEKFS